MDIIILLMLELEVVVVAANLFNVFINFDVER